MDARADKPIKRAWTQADADVIRAMLIEGKTYREVGAQLGASRNAVAGVCDRFGIRAATLTSRANNHVRNPKELVSKTKAKKRRTQADHVADHAAAKARASATAQQLARGEHGGGIPLWELGSRCCRFSTGETEDGRILFCGEIAAPGVAWCTKHRERVYIKRN